MGAVHLRNNTKNPFVLPLALGRPVGKSSRVITIDPGLNETSDEVLRLISGGGVDEHGHAKGGSAGKYFNNRTLQIAHAPLAGDECHKVTSVTGIKRSKKSRTREDDRHRQAKLESVLFALLGRELDSMSQSEIDETVSRSRRTETPVESAEVLLDPSEYTVSELRRALEGLDIDELMGVMKLERERDGGHRKGAVDAIADAMKG